MLFMHKAKEGEEPAVNIRSILVIAKLKPDVANHIKFAIENPKHEAKFKEFEKPDKAAMRDYLNSKRLYTDSVGLRFDVHLHFIELDLKEPQKMRDELNKLVQINAHFNHIFFYLRDKDVAERLYAENLYVRLLQFLKPDLSQHVHSFMYVNNITQDKVAQSLIRNYRRITGYDYRGRITIPQRNLFSKLSDTQFGELRHQIFKFDESFKLECSVASGSYVALHCRGRVQAFPDNKNLFVITDAISVQEDLSIVPDSPQITRNTISTANDSRQRQPNDSCSNPGSHETQQVSRDSYVGSLQSGEPFSAAFNSGQATQQQSETEQTQYQKNEFPKVQYYVRMGIKAASTSISRLGAMKVELEESERSNKFYGQTLQTLEKVDAIERLSRSDRGIMSKSITDQLSQSMRLLYSQQEVRLQQSQSSRVNILDSQHTQQNISMIFGAQERTNLRPQTVDAVANSQEFVQAFKRDYIQIFTDHSQLILPALDDEEAYLYLREAQLSFLYYLNNSVKGLLVLADSPVTEHANTLSDFVDAFEDSRTLREGASLPTTGADLVQLVVNLLATTNCPIAHCQIHKLRFLVQLVSETQTTVSPGDLSQKTSTIENLSRIHAARVEIIQKGKLAEQQDRLHCVRDLFRKQLADFEDNEEEDPTNCTLQEAEQSRPSSSSELRDSSMKRGADTFVYTLESSRTRRMLKGLDAGRIKKEIIEKIQEFRQGLELNATEKAWKKDAPIAAKFKDYFSYDPVDNSPRMSESEYAPQAPPVVQVKPTIKNKRLEKQQSKQGNSPASLKQTALQTIRTITDQSQPDKSTDTVSPRKTRSQTKQAASVVLTESPPKSLPKPNEFDWNVLAGVGFHTNDPEDHKLVNQGHAALIQHREMYLNDFETNRQKAFAVFKNNNSPQDSKRFDKAYMTLQKMEGNGKKQVKKRKPAAKPGKK